MRVHHATLPTLVVGAIFYAFVPACSSQDPNQLTSDPQATDEELRRHCTGQQIDDDWAERCAKWWSKHDASAPAPTTTTTAPPPPPTPPPTTTSTTTATTPPPPPPPAPTTCTSFTYSAWGACQPNGTQTRTVVSSSPAGCTGGSPVLSHSCTYVDGEALYTQYCSGCHGSSKKGSSVTAITDAINNNVGGMGSLKTLTAAQIAAISAAP